MVKIVNNNGQYKITLPKDIVEAKGWSSKTKLRFVEDVDGNIILKEIIDTKENKLKKAKGQNEGEK